MSEPTANDTTLKAFRVLAALEAVGAERLKQFEARVVAEGHYATAAGDRESAREANAWWEISTVLRTLAALLEGEGAI